MRILPWLVPAALCVLLPGTASAKDETVKFGKQGKGLGIGLSLGGPTGLSIKYFLRARHAFQFHLAWGVLHQGDGILSVDYVWHTPDVGDNPSVDANFYFGLGVGLAFWARNPPGVLVTHDHLQRSRGGAAFMIKVPILGIAFHWTGAPIDTVIEAAWSPYIVIPDLKHLDTSMKFRYYF